MAEVKNPQGLEIAKGSISDVILNKNPNQQDGAVTSVLFVKLLNMLKNQIEEQETVQKCLLSEDA